MLASPLGPEVDAGWENPAGCSADGAELDNPSMYGTGNLKGPEGLKGTKHKCLPSQDPTAMSATSW